jgi:DNA-binding transcriptional LysR family regulator
MRLLDRTTRIVRVTGAGERYLTDARRIIENVDAANDAATGINAEPQGHLAVTAPVLFGKMYFLPYVIAYMRRYPATDVPAIFLDRTVNLLEEGFDVGVQFGKLPDSSMKALNVANIRQVTCASPSYLKKNGVPRIPTDL